jgi:hypothetical protein
MSAMTLDNPVQGETHLPQSHLIGQNPIQSILVQTNHPLHSGELIVSEFGASNESGLGKGVLFGTTLLFVFLGVNVGLVFAICLGCIVTRITVAILL